MARAEDLTLEVRAAAKARGADFNGDRARSYVLERGVIAALRQHQNPRIGHDATQVVEFLQAVQGAFHTGQLACHHRAAVDHTDDEAVRRGGIQLVDAAHAAGAGQVVRMVLGRGLALTALGLALGLISALALSRFLASLLFATRPGDPLVLTAVSLLLLAVTLVACMLPALRAARTDPVRVLSDGSA